MSRKMARKNAFYLVFQIGFNAEEEREGMKKIFFDEMQEGISSVDKEFALSEANGVEKNLSEIDEIINLYARSWSVERMSQVDLAILRLGVYEIKFSDDIPKSVAINEAVELAKEFSSDEAPKFINGILAKV